MNSFSERVAERGRAPAALALNPRQRSELVGRDRQSRLTRSPPDLLLPGSRRAAEQRSGQRQSPRRALKDPCLFEQKVWGVPGDGRRHVCHPGARSPLVRCDWVAPACPSLRQSRQCTRRQPDVTSSPGSPQPRILPYKDTGSRCACYLRSFAHTRTQGATALRRGRRHRGFPPVTERARFRQRRRALLAQNRHRHSPSAASRRRPRSTQLSGLVWTPDRTHLLSRMVFGSWATSSLCSQFILQGSDN